MTKKTVGGEVNQGGNVVDLGYVWKALTQIISGSSQEDLKRGNLSDQKTSSGGEKSGGEMTNQGGDMADFNYRDYMKPRKSADDLGLFLKKHVGERTEVFCGMAIVEEQAKQKLQLAVQYLIDAGRIYTAAYIIATKPYTSYDYSTALSTLNKNGEQQKRIPFSQLEGKPFYLDSDLFYESIIGALLSEDSSTSNPIFYNAFYDTLGKGTGGIESLKKSCMIYHTMLPNEKSAICSEQFIREVNECSRVLHDNPTAIYKALDFNQLLANATVAQLLRDKVQESVIGLGRVVTDITSMGSFSPQWAQNSNAIIKWMSNYVQNLDKNLTSSHVSSEKDEMVRILQEVLKRDPYIEVHMLKSFVNVLNSKDETEYVIKYCQNNFIDPNNQIYICKNETFQFLGSVLQFHINELEKPASEEF